MTVEIRILRPEDESILDNIGPDLFDDPLDQQATRAFLADPRHHIVVAIDAGVVVGFVSAVHYVHPDKAAPELWINEVAVAPTGRGRGIGKAMLASLLEHARTLGCGEAWVLTDRSNEAAMRLYRGLDGTESDAVMFTFQLPQS